MRKLNLLVMFTIQIKNCNLNITMVIKVDKGIVRCLSRNSYTSYNSICLKLILKLQIKNTGIQIVNINTRHDQQQTFVKTVDA